jgi:uncharacterized membrane protein
MSNRRFATIASLLGLTLLVYAMVGVRVAHSGTLHFVNLVWNLFLAWIPFGLALLVDDGFRRGAPRKLLVLGGGLWLLFIPNAPYITTDLKYVGDWGGAPLWYDFALAGAAATIGLALGFFSLYLMERIVGRVAGAVSAWLFVAGVLVLSSLGVLLGRFQRWNSWDVFTRPGSLFDDLWTAATSPAEHVRLLVLGVLFTGFLGACYLVFYSLARASLRQPTDS